MICLNMILKKSDVFEQSWCILAEYWTKTVFLILSFLGCSGLVFPKGRIRIWSWPELKVRYIFSPDPVKASENISGSSRPKNRILEP